MGHITGSFIRFSFLAVIFVIWWWLLNTTLLNSVNLSIIIGAVLLSFPLVWFGRKILDKNTTASRVILVTSVIHYIIVFLLGSAIIRALVTHKDWPVWTLPIPTGIGLFLVIITGAICVLPVANLALKGWGAPFAVALTQKLAVDWLYAWTRNPMILATVVFFVSLGIWFQSVMFILWTLLLFAPALLFFVKVYEERELELRFGASYLEYKTKTPMLIPWKKPDKKCI